MGQINLLSSFEELMGRFLPWEEVFIGGLPDDHHCLLLLRPNAGETM